MAVLNKIRQRSVFLIGIIGLALFAFILSGLIKNGGFKSKNSQNVIATVNGEDISREDFARQVEAYQRNMGPNATTTQVVNQVWDAKLREVVLKEEMDKLGIEVGEAQVKQALRQQLAGNPNFTNDAGMFDENKLQEYVANLKATSPQAYQQWLAFENSIAESARENIYFNLIRAGVGATLVEGEQAYKMANNNADLQYVQIPYSSIPDSEVNVSKEDINNYIKKHSDRFQTETTRDIQYVYFPEAASSEDEAQAKEDLSKMLNDREEFNAGTKSNDTVAGFKNVSQKDIEEYVNRNSDIPFQDKFIFKDEIRGDHTQEIYNLNPGEVFGPYKEGGYWKATRMLDTKEMADSAKASHIMISWKGLQTAAGTERTKNEAKQLADSLANVVKKDPSKFEELAKTYSQDPGSAAKGGDLGWFRPGMMVGDFNDFVFSHDKGEVGVVETNFGYHVIKVEDKTDKKKAVKIATIARDIEPSEKSLNDLFTEVTKFEMAAKDKGFTDVAKTDNYDVKTVRDMKVLDENIPGVGSQRRIVQWAFQDDVDKGTIKRFETSNGYVVAQLTAINEKGLMTPENASATVTPILQKEKKAKLIKDKITETSLDQIAKNHNVSVQTANAVNLDNPTLAGAGREPEVVGAAFSLDKGQVSKPIAGDKGVYVVKLEELHKAPEMKNYKGFALKETAQRRQTVNTRVFEALKNNADIKDNRARFY